MRPAHCRPRTTALVGQVVQGVDILIRSTATVTDSATSISSHNLLVLPENYLHRIRSGTAARARSPASSRVVGSGTGSASEPLATDSPK